MIKTQTITYILLFFLSYNIFSQLDNTNNGINKGNNSFGTIDFNAVETEKPKTLDFNNNSGFKTAGQDLKKKQEEEQKERELQNKGVISKAKLAEESYLKNFKKINGLYDYPVINQDLGTIHTNSDNVYIIYRDYQHPDGDRVSISMDGEVVLPNITLTRQYKSSLFPLKLGFNKLEITALNQGDSGPNTANFKIYDDDKLLLSAKEWQLATGAIAKFIIIKDK